MRLDAAAVPLMNGALEVSASGVASSLLPDNLKAAAAVANTDEPAKQKTWPLLFDPQTSGGLLAGCVLNRFMCLWTCFSHTVECWRALFAVVSAVACLQTGTT